MVRTKLLRPSTVQQKFIFLVGPYFVIYLNKVKVFTSSVVEGVKKSDGHIWFELRKPQLLCGDIRIEFYNKPKMSRKVLITYELRSMKTISV